MQVYEFSSYKDYTLARIKAMPRAGHGQFMKMAKHIGVSPVVISQVLKGDRDFTEEQALRLTDFLGLSNMESEYFMRMVSLEKAGTHDLKRFHRDALAALKRQAQATKNRVGAHQVLDESTKSVFYSDWIYGAVRLLTSVEKFGTADAIAEHLDLSHARVNEILEFLMSVGLVKIESGRLMVGVRSTHLDAQSRFVNNHHRNWRLRGLQALNSRTPVDLFYTAPCTLSEEDFLALREDLVKVIANLTKRAPTSTPETLACLNIDWFRA
ncbi:MAG: TIGR02147 family protein [Bdellovibrionales bacterium]